MKKYYKKWPRILSHQVLYTSNTNDTIENPSDQLVPDVQTLLNTVNTRLLNCPDLINIKQILEEHPDMLLHDRQQIWNGLQQKFPSSNKSCSPLKYFQNDSDTKAEKKRSKHLEDDFNISDEESGHSPKWKRLRQGTAEVILNNS